VHAVVGSVAFLFMLAHPIFLVLKYIPQNTYLAAIYLLPGSHWSINFGVWAFLLTIILMSITLFIKKMKYHHRKVSHTFFSLAFLFVAIHVFLIKWELARIYFPWYHVYAIWVLAVGLTSYLYTLRKKLFQNQKFFVCEVVWLHHYDTATECVFLPRGRKIQYNAGQFAFVQFENTNITKESHPFSFASYNPKDNKFKMIIKHSWDYTKTLYHLKIGNTAIIEWPYGKFVLDLKHKKNIWIAWGIGITPFMSMASKLHFYEDMSSDLYYLVRDEKELLWLGQLENLANITPGLRVIPWISSQQWRLSLSNIKDLSWNLDEYVYYLCWPDAMKISFTEELQKQGISKEHIYTEWYNFKI